MAITGLSPNTLPVTVIGAPGGALTRLVENGPQIINARLPEAVVTDSQGRPRAGLSRYPADIAFKEFIQANVENIINANAPPGVGSVIDLMG